MLHLVAGRKLVVVLGQVVGSCLVVGNCLVVDTRPVVGIHLELVGSLVVDTALEVGKHQAVVVDILDMVVELHQEVDSLVQVVDNCLVVDMHLVVVDMRPEVGSLLDRVVDMSLGQVDILDSHLVVGNHLELQVQVADPIGLAVQEHFYCEIQTYLAYSTWIGHDLGVLSLHRPCLRRLCRLLRRLYRRLHPFHRFRHHLLCHHYHLWHF